MALIDKTHAIVDITIVNTIAIVNHLSLDISACILCIFCILSSSVIPPFYPIKNNF